MPIHGHDPLAHMVSEDPEQREIIDSVVRQSIVNILRSYTGFYDLFSEGIQNALDAVQLKFLTQASQNYKPKIWIGIDLRNTSFRVVDNGIGMNEREFKFCFTPNISFKRNQNLRGQKGVGATFLAYGFSFAKLQTKRDASRLSAVLRGGRLWADDPTGKITRPTLEELVFNVPELEAESSGTAIELKVGNTPGERPRDFGWNQATTARQWLDVLRIKTPLGGVYLCTSKFLPEVHVSVTDYQGAVTQETTHAPEYYYPHEIPSVRQKDLREIRTRLDDIDADSETQLRKLPEEYKKLDCIWEIWDSDQICDQESILGSRLDEAQRTLVNKYKVVVYGAFVRSTKILDEFNDVELGLRKGYRILQGGLQMASDFMIQGELITIPLTKTIGWQNNTHVVVHFTEGNPDLGRKTFQPEFHALGELLATQAVKQLTRFRSHLRADAGAVVVIPDKELYEWKKSQEAWRDSHPLNLTGIKETLTVVSEPQEEQDVISLFHQLVGAGVLRGIQFFSAHHHERYDALIKLAYDSSLKFNGKVIPYGKLGVSQTLDFPYQTEPKVLEYKYDLDDLASDFDSETKHPEHIDLVVCWTATGKYESKLDLKPLLIGDAGDDRLYYGSTHAACLAGVYSKPVFEVIILSDLCRFLVDPRSEEARQKAHYGQN